MRVEEARESVGQIKQAMAQVPGGPLATALGPLPAFEPAFGMWKNGVLTSS